MNTPLPKGGGFGSTNECVAFTLTINLPTDDAEKAIGWMAHTAMRQAEIKKAVGGVRWNPCEAYTLDGGSVCGSRSGRGCQKSTGG